MHKNGVLLLIWVIARISAVCYFKLPIRPEAFRMRAGEISNP